MFETMYHIIYKLFEFVGAFNYGFKQMHFTREAKEMYYTLSPLEFLEDKCGVCTDYALFLQDQFEKAGLRSEIYAITHEIGTDFIFHMLAVAYVENYIILPDPCNHSDLQGLYVYKSEKEFVHDYLEREQEVMDDFISSRCMQNMLIKTTVYKVTPLYGVSRDEWISHIRESEVVCVRY